MTTPIVTEPTHGEITISEAKGEIADNKHFALMERLFDVSQRSGYPITATGEELTNVAKAWLKYVQEKTDFCICPLCCQKVNPSRSSGK